MPAARPEPDVAAARSQRNTAGGPGIVDNSVIDATIGAAETLRRRSRRPPQPPLPSQPSPLRTLTTTARQCAVQLLALELTRCRSLPRPSPDVEDTNDVGALVDGEEHAIDVRAATEIEDANRLIWIETLRHYRASFWIQAQRENRFLETVEPCSALAWRSLDDPQIQFFELGFGALRDLNAECHACAAAG